MITDREIAGRFNAQLGSRCATQLVGGGCEPLYLPARGNAWATIRYTRNYPRSALHELAHWALAGPRRRKLVDYGYWYVAPPRDRWDQEAFFDAEVSVQALESLFCRICDLDFHVSVDDIGVESGDFAERVAASAIQWHRSGLTGSPARIARILGMEGGACE